MKIRWRSVQTLHEPTDLRIDELFYLMSRGLTETQAQEMVILGFVQPILSHIKNENIQQVIYTEFAKLLK